MRTLRRGGIGLTLAVAALAVLSDAIRAQEVEPVTWRGTEVRAVDATRGLAVDEDQTIRIQIRNDLSPMGSVVASLVSATRPELVLGAVLPNEAREFLIDTRLFPGGIRLIATGNQAGTQISRRIDVANRALIKWNLETGLVRVERLADDEDEDG